MVLNRVEAVRGAIKRLLVTRCPEERSPEAQPVAIERQLRRGHLRIDLRLATGNRVVRVVPEHLIKRVRNVPPAHMSVAGPTQVVGFYSVRLDVADQSGSNQKVVLVEVPARAVIVEVKTELSRVAVEPRVLAKEVCDEHTLVAEVRRVQLAVRILLEHVKVCRVELVTI